MFDSRVRYSETDINGYLTVPAIINYMQDCCYFHSEHLHIGEEYLKASGKMWMLAYWQIVIEQYPKVCQDIRIGTGAYASDSRFGYRNFAITDPANGAYFAKANSVWVLADLKTGRPVRLREEDIAPYGRIERIPMDYADRKIRLPEGGEEKEPFSVQPYHLDTNHHVNNGQYVQMAASYLPEEMQIRELRADYKRPAVLGDMIYPVVCRVDDSWMVALNGETGRSYAVIQFF